MTIEQVKEQAKELFNQDITDEMAQSLLNEYGARELSDQTLAEISAGAGGDTVWRPYTYHCFNCQWEGTAFSLGEATEKHKQECLNCSSPYLISEEQQRWLAHIAKFPKAAIF